MKIVIIDYGLGNLRSVYNALVSLGAKAKISESPADIAKADKVILPGVGAFGDAMLGLKKRGLAEAIKKFLSGGGVYLGMCLGLQILFEESEEGNSKGLGIFKGKVKRFREESGVKVPHIGWNEVKFQIPCLAGRQANSKSRITDGIKSGAYFYFVHSYYAAPADLGLIAATTDYGVNFTSMIQRDNIYAVQFHPERSQELGLKFLENFIKL